MDAGYCLVRIESFLSGLRNEIYFSAIYFLDTCLKVSLLSLSVIVLIIIIITGPGGSISYRRRI